MPFKNVKFNDSYKTIKEVIKSARKGYNEARIKRLLGLDNESDVVVSRILDYIFTDARGSDTGPKVFDEVEDFRYYYPSFIQCYGVDLLKDDISYFAFNSMLEALMAQKCLIANIIGIRSSEMPKDGKARQNMVDLKNKYALTSGKGDLSSLFRGAKAGAKNGRR